MKDLKSFEIIKLNKERELKEKLFKQTIDQLKQIRDIFRKNLYDKIKEIKQNTSS